MTVDAHGMPLRAIITEGTVADCGQAMNLMEGFHAEDLLADRGYGTHDILQTARQAEMKAVFPPKRNRLEQRDYDTALYEHRHLVENAFLHLKKWRGITTRYAKNLASFLAAVHIRCIAIWVTTL